MPAARKKPPRASRRRSRELAVQALYSRELQGGPLFQNPANFADADALAHADRPYLQECLAGLRQDEERVRQLLERHCERELDSLGCTERAVLSLSLWELLARADVPTAVVLDEGVRLARLFCDPPGYRLVNGLLEAAAQELRQGWQPKRAAE